MKKELTKKEVMEKAHKEALLFAVYFHWVKVYLGPNIGMNVQLRAIKQFLNLRPQDKEELNKVYLKEEQAQPLKEIIYQLRH